MDVLLWQAPLYFVLLLLFGFLPGIVNDLRLVKNVPWDSIGLSLGLCFLLHDCAPAFKEMPAMTLLCLLAGLTVASFERFCVGFVFHCRCGVRTCLTWLP